MDTYEPMQSPPLHSDLGPLEKELMYAVWAGGPERLAEVPGLGVDSATQIIAEVGPTRRWGGACRFLDTLSKSRRQCLAIIDL